jgi:hypothetical protein
LLRISELLDTGYAVISSYSIEDRTTSVKAQLLATPDVDGVMQQ